MASSYNLSYFLNRQCRLVLFGTLMWAMSVSENTDVISFSAEIGGNVTFPCPINMSRRINFYYVQRGNIFINGYHSTRKTKGSWENTRWNDREKAVHMSGVNMSHSGNYECHVQYDDDKTNKYELYLTVTANYSKPTFTRTCTGDKEDFRCLVTCTSHGGYPKMKMRFEANVSGSQSGEPWKVENRSEMQNTSTMVYDSSITASFNCSQNEKLDYFRCSVGEMASDMFSACEPRAPPTTDYQLMAVFGAVLVIIGIVVGLVLLLKKRKRQEGADLQEGGSAESVTFLKEVQTTP